MKRTILITLVVCVLLLGFVPRTHARAGDPPRAISQASTQSVDTMMEEDTQVASAVEYILPYPGILPDHPLFTLKMLRDWIIERLITDPLRKSEFYILQSDKRMAMAIAFMEKSKPEGAVATTVDAQSFMAKAVAEATGYKQTGIAIPGHIIDRFERAIAKHIATITQFASGGEETHRASFRASLEGYQTIASEAATLVN